MIQATRRVRDRADRGTAVWSRGGCAFRGARLALQPIVDAAHLVHGPPGCLGHSWESRPTSSSGPVLHRTTFSSALREVDVVQGGAARLEAAIAALVARHDPPAIFVYQTCLTGMIGDDLEALCRSAGARYGRPVIPVDVPGFTGGNVHGSAHAARLLVDRVVGTLEPGAPSATDVLLLGSYGVAGEAADLRRLLGAAGMRVVAALPGEARFREVAGAHRARAAVSLCARALAGVARALEERFGVPWLPGCFFGVAQTSRTLRGLAELLLARGAPVALRASVEELVVREEARLARELAPLRRRLRGRRALVVAGGVKSWALVGALRELGMEVVATSAHKALPEDLRELARLGGRTRVLPALGPGALEALLVQHGVEVLLGGGAARFAAVRARAGLVDVQHERTQPYTGYQGMLALARAVERAAAGPARRAALRPAPWEAGIEEATGT